MPHTLGELALVNRAVGIVAPARAMRSACAEVADEQLAADLQKRASAMHAVFCPFAFIQIAAAKGASARTAPVARRPLANIHVAVDAAHDTEP